MNRPLIVALLFLGVYANAQSPTHNTYKEISIADLAKKIQKGDDIVIIDVRTPGEFNDTLSQSKYLNLGRLKSAINVNLPDLTDKPETIGALEKYKNKDVYLLCSHSYRSRVASNHLLANGFKYVTNVQGGMSEWYRLADQLGKYAAVREAFINYKNISAPDLFNQLSSGNVQLIGIHSTSTQRQDSIAINFYKQFPDFKSAAYFTIADSLTLLEKAKSLNGTPIVTFHTSGQTGAEVAEWMTTKGIPNVSYLVGNLLGFYEYVVNAKPDKLQAVLKQNSAIRFHTALSLCRELNKNSNMQLIDLRADTLFNNVTKGTKLNYKSLKGAVNFPASQGADSFAQHHPDKSKTYILIQRGLGGFSLADELIKRGYSIGWLIGGNERWEWYVNNTEFPCGGFLVQ